MESVTIPEAAETTGLTPREVRLSIERGLVSAFEEDGRWRIPHEELDGLLTAAAEAERQERADHRHGPELAALRARLDQVEQRLEKLEQAQPIRGRGGAMRPALAPLFAERGGPEDR